MFGINMGVIMDRVKPIATEKASGKVKELYDAIQKKMGRVPNIFLNMGNSPAVLEGYLGLSQAVDHTSLSPQLREQIALTVGQANHCNYCLSAHTMIAKGAGIAENDIIHARQAHSNDPKTEAILKFVKHVVDTRAHINNQDVSKLKLAGVTDKELVEIILVMSINLFTNYFNHITDTKIDFPEAPAIK